MEQKHILIGIFVVLALGVLSYVGLFSGLTGKVSEQNYYCVDTDDNAIGGEARMEGIVQGTGSSGQDFYVRDVCENENIIIEMNCAPEVASGYSRDPELCPTGTQCVAGACK